MKASQVVRSACVRNLLDDIAVWGWAKAPAERLVFAADIPKLDRALPRALPPDVDARLMATVANLPGGR